MNHIQRMLCFVLCIVIIAGLACGCSKKMEPSAEVSETSVYATFYPLYAAIEMIAEGVPDMKLNCLVQPNDGCLRNYQLSDWDLALLNTADLIIAGGRGLESFESVLYELGDEGPVVSSVLYNMDLRGQRALNTDEDSQSHWLDLNPHIYMQIEPMKEIVRRVANTLILFDAENESLYLKNLERAQLRLDDLHDEIEKNLSGVQDGKVIVMNEALVYAAQEYGLEPCLFYDRESGAGLYGSDLSACIDALKKVDAEVVLIEKQAPQALCEALEAAGYRVALLDILSTHRASEGAQGYFNAHKANAQALIAAFDDQEN